MVAPPLKLRHRRRLNPLGEGRHGFNREVVVAESGPAPPWRRSGPAPPLQLADPASLQPRDSPYSWSGSCCFGNSCGGGMEFYGENGSTHWEILPPWLESHAKTRSPALDPSKALLSGNDAYNARAPIGKTWEHGPVPLPRETTAPHSSAPKCD